MTSRDPFARSADLPTFSLTSTTVADGEPFGPAQMSAIFGVPGGADTSPQLAWSGAPDGTKSFLVTMYDPDAPTQSGFWHWMVAGISADTTELAENAGDPDAGLLPDGAFHIAGDAQVARFLGAAPPAGDDPHRYFVTVFALGTDDLAEVRDARPAVAEFMLRDAVLARATIVPTASIPG